MNDKNNYIDIHSHIMPGIDDGATDMNQTFRMLQIAVSEHIMTIIATPHYICGRHNPDPGFLGELKDRVQELARSINKDLKVYLGNEIYYSDSVIGDLKKGKALTLAGSRYVLVEFSPEERFNAIYHGIGELIRHGYMPILAHTERYVCLYRNNNLISELVKAGCYIQINCRSVMGGRFSRKAAYIRWLVDEGLVHFLGSDSHRDDIRPPIMETAVRQLVKRCDTEKVGRIIYENPLKVIENIYI